MDNIVILNGHGWMRAIVVLSYVTIKYLTEWLLMKAIPTSP